MAKKILIIVGGGRPAGNTAQLVSAFEKGAVEAGHQVEQVSLLKTEVKGCLGCNACRYGKPCIQKDGFHDLIPKIENADLMVSYYKFTLVNYIGFCDRGMLLAGGCGDTGGKPQIDRTNYLEEAYALGFHL